MNSAALKDPAAAVAWLLTPAAIRARANALYDHAVAGRSAHFVLNPEALNAAAAYVAETIRANYPTLDIPYHARWRHFAAGGVDRWGKLAAAMKHQSADELARIRFDLAVISVLLDAGAGAAWRFREAETGQVIPRSEGLGVASMHAFCAGLFSGDPADPMRADAAGLSAFTAEKLAKAFQVTPENPLTGLEGRAALMRALGSALIAAPTLFGRDNPRIGHLYDYLKGQAVNGALPAAAILAALLKGLGSIWPGRIVLGGVNLGDVWRHSAIRADDATDGLVPFHKLSQWLAYSLAEPLEDAGLRVVDLDALTGLPEYRNGGLFLDLGVIALRDPAMAAAPLPVEHELIVEWRALTVALLDRIADPVRRALGKTAAEMPLARVLEGGTWSAGRRIAAAKRPGGGPPLNVVSDGTVF